MKKRYIYILITIIMVCVITGFFVFFLKNKNYPVNIDGVDIKEQPKRIISMSKSVTELLNNNGYKEFLVGVPSYYEGNDEFKDIKKVGTSQVPNIDEITNLGANILITSTPFTNQHKLKIEQGGTIIITISPSINKDEFNNIAKNVFMLMEGNNKYNKIFTDYVEKNNSELESLYSKSKVKDGQTFAIIPEINTISTNDTIEGSILSNLMGQNVTGDATNFSFTIDELKEKNPEYLIVRNGVDITSLKDLDAVKNQKVIYIDFSGFEQNNYNGIKDSIKFILDKVYGVKVDQEDKNENSEDEKAQDSEYKKPNSNETENLSNPENPNNPSNPSNPSNPENPDNKKWTSFY